MSESQIKKFKKFDRKNWSKYTDYRFWILTAAWTLQLSIPSLERDELLRGLSSNEMDMRSEWNNDPDAQNMFSINHHMLTVMTKIKNGNTSPYKWNDYLLTLLKMYP